MRKKVIAISILGFAALVAIAWYRRREAVREAPRAVDLRPALRNLAQTLPPSQGNPQEIRDCLREAARAYRAREMEAFSKAYAQIVQQGAAIQRLLAELLLELKDPTEILVAAQALSEVATAEIVPFALALAASDLPEEARAAALQLLTRFRAEEARGLAGPLLFSDASVELKRAAIDYFAAMSDEEILARASVEASPPELRSAAAQALGKIGTPSAADRLLSAWKGGFKPDGAQVLENYYLLKALATFAPEILRPMVRGFLATEADANARNVFLSALGRADRGLALETVREILNLQPPGPFRNQAIQVLGSIGGAEAQEIVLGLLTSTADAKEEIECGNALLHQEKGSVPFDKAREMFDRTVRPWARSILAHFLTRYAKELRERPDLLAALEREERERLGSPDGMVRAVAVQLGAALAQYASDPPGRLLELYSGLANSERRNYPDVFLEMGKYAEDARVRTLFSAALGDPSVSTPHRLIAGEALFTSGASEEVYRAIAASTEEEVATLLVQMTLSHDGSKAGKRLDEIARACADETKRTWIQSPLREWLKEEDR